MDANAMTETVSTPLTTEAQAGKAPAAEAAAIPSASSPEAGKPEETKKEPLSPALAALAKKQKEILRQRESVKLKEQALLEREAKLREIEDRISKFESLSDPLEALKLKGWSYKDVTDFVLNNNKPTPEQQIKSVEQQMRDWMSKQEDAQKKAAEEATSRAKAEMDAVVTNFKGEIAEFLDAHKDTYELTSLYQQQELVFSTVQAHFDQTGKVMSIKEASELVEKYLEEQVEQSLKTKKLQSRLAPRAAEGSKPEGKAGATTLTNQMSSSAPSMVSPRIENDRMKRALAALESGGL